jgi:hypothetical protein
MVNSNISTNPMNQPSSLQLSRSQIDGSLLTAPLRSVVIGTTDAIYDDLHTMSSGGEIPILQTTSSAKAAVGEDGSSSQTPSNSNSNTPSATPQPSGNYPNQQAPVRTDATVRRDNLANLSFAQRRNELSIRLNRHTRAVQHVTALVSAYSAVTDHSDSSNRETTSTTPTGSPMKQGHGASTASHPESIMGLTIGETSESLKTVYQKTMGADEAQDALYFHHAELWKARRHVHDVKGALSILCGQGWVDMPTDIRLTVDKYAESEERQWGQDETLHRLQGCVRRKLLHGEVGQLRKRQQQLQLQGDEASHITRRGGLVLPWKVTMEKGGCALRLTYGQSKRAWMEQMMQSDVGGGGGGDYQTLINQKEGAEAVDDVFPIEARVTVLSEDDDAPWTLLSLDVTTQPKTGESSHQLDPNNHQRFNLHRLCAQAMAVEEERHKQQQKKDDETNNEEKTTSSAKRIKLENEETDDDGDKVMANKNQDQLESDSLGEKSSSASVVTITRTTRLSCARPLRRLFEVAHTFAVSLQLEMLSAQAEALKRGSWGIVETVRGGGANTASSSIQVSPIRYLDASSTSTAPSLNKKSGSTAEANRRKRDGVSVDDAATFLEDDDEAPSTQSFMALHFWSCDDRFGAPKIRDVSLSENHHDNTNASTSVSASGISEFEPHVLKLDDNKESQRLSLFIRTVPRVGLVVSLPGGEEVMSFLQKHKDAGSDSSDTNSNSSSSDYSYLKRNVDKLQGAVHNPFSLSAADAILAATVICAHFKCAAVVEALQSLPEETALPSWMSLRVEAGTITVSVQITYDDHDDDSNAQQQQPPPLNSRAPVAVFRTLCDTRTGKFVPVFPSSMILLRALSCNDLRVSAVARFQANSMASANQMKRRAIGALGKDMSGRIVKDAFDGLVRSMDSLSDKAGVGVTQWEDLYDTTTTSSSTNNAGNDTTGGDVNNENTPHRKLSANAKLRAKTVEVACGDVKRSLQSCCGMAAVYGVAAGAMTVTCGADVMVDM